MHQQAEMATREDDISTVTIATTELKPSMREWPVEDVHKESMVLRTLAKMWLEITGLPDHK